MEQSPSPRRNKSYSDTADSTVTPTLNAQIDKTSSLGNKIFLTTSDVIKRINSTLNEDDDNSGGSGLGGKGEGGSGGFELQRQFADGYTRKANDADVALVDFQSKVKQAAQMVSTLSPEKKMEWAKIHRQRGNDLFKKGDYKEAMDVYLTCLVAIEHDDGGGNDSVKPAFLNNTTTTEEAKYSATTSTNPAITGSSSLTVTTKTVNVYNKISGNDSKTTVQEEEDNKIRWSKRTDEEIKLPILLNLSLCTLKMGMYQKTEQFCDFAIMEMACGRTSTKAYFRRGRARMLMGSYHGAKEDFSIALELLSEAIKDGSDDIDNTDNIKEREAEIKAVKNEMLKLGRLTEAGKINREKCERAMKKILGGGDGESRESKGVVYSSVEDAIMKNGPNDAAVPRKPAVESNPAEDNQIYSTRLYEDVARRRMYSTLRAKSRKKLEDRNILPEEERSFVLWYISMMERSIRKMLHWLGDKDAMTRSFEELEEEFSKTKNEKKEF